MQNEILRRNAPAAARGVIAPDVRLCVACLHENRGNEQSCEACGTSLFLILCGACEAVNRAGELRCHGCGAALGLCGACETVNGAGALRCNGCGAGLGTETSDEPAAAPPASRTDLARIEASDKRAAAPPTRRMNRRRFALILAAGAVTTAGFAYHYSGWIAKADRPADSDGIEVAHVKTVDPPTEPKAGAPAGGPPTTVGSAPKARPAYSGVTHTRPAEASQTAPSAPVAGQRTQAKAAAPAGGPSASAGSAPEARPAYARVTHTRPADASKTAPTAAVAQAAPDAGQKSEIGCGEAVAALGLCNPRGKSGGK